MNTTKLVIASVVAALFVTGFATDAFADSVQDGARIVKQFYTFNVIYDKPLPAGKHIDAFTATVTDINGLTATETISGGQLTFIKGEIGGSLPVGFDTSDITVTYTVTFKDAPVVKQLDPVTDYKYNANTKVLDWETVPNADQYQLWQDGVQLVHSGTKHTLTSGGSFVIFAIDTTGVYASSTSVAIIIDFNKSVNVERADPATLDKKDTDKHMGVPAELTELKINNSTVNFKDRMSVKIDTIVTENPMITMDMVVDDEDSHIRDVVVYIERPQFQQQSIGQYAVISQEENFNHADWAELEGFSTDFGTQKYHTTERDFDGLVDYIVFNVDTVVEGAEDDRANGMNLKATTTTLSLQFYVNFDIEEADIHVVTRDAFMNMNHYTVYNAITVETFDSKVLDIVNDGCGKHKNVAEGEYKKCISNPRDY